MASSAELRWPDITRALQEQGFPAVLPLVDWAPHSLPPGASVLPPQEATKLQATLLALLAQRSRHAQLVQQLGEQAAAARREQASAAAQHSSLQQQCQQLQAQLAAEQEALQRERQLRHSEQQQQAALQGRLEAAVGSLQAKLKTAASQREAMERELQSLRASWQQRVEREEAWQQRLDRLFLELRGRRLHQRSSLDTRLMEVIDLYERRLKTTAEDMARVKAELRDLQHQQRSAGTTEPEQGEALLVANTVDVPTPLAAEQKLVQAQREADVAQKHAKRLAKELDDLRTQYTATQLEVCWMSF